MLKDTAEDELVNDSELQNDPKLFSDDEIPEKTPPGKRLVCCPAYKHKSGKWMVASHYGKKAFCFYVNE